MEIRMSGIVKESIVDGEGIRFALFTQGCPHKCEGCHNPQTHSFDGGFLADTVEIFKEIIQNPMLDGVTFSGGEPFCQCKPLTDLARRIHAFKGFKLDIVVFTGFSYEYLLANANEENGYLELLNEVDYLVDGKFVLPLRTLELRFRGSSNQRYIDVKKSLEKGEVVCAL